MNQTEPNPIEDFIHFELGLISAWISPQLSMSLQFVIGVDRTPEHRLSKHVLMSANGGGGGRGGPCSTWWVGPTEVDPGQRQERAMAN